MDYLYLLPIIGDEPHSLMYYIEEIEKVAVKIVGFILFIVDWSYLFEQEVFGIKIYWICGVIAAIHLLREGIPMLFRMQLEMVKIVGTILAGKSARLTLSGFGKLFFLLKKSIVLTLSRTTNIDWGDAFYSIRIFFTDWWYRIRS